MVRTVYTCGFPQSSALAAALVSGAGIVGAQHVRPFKGALEGVFEPCAG